MKVLRRHLRTIVNAQPWKPVQVASPTAVLAHSATRRTPSSEPDCTTCNRRVPRDFLFLSNPRHPPIASAALARMVTINLLLVGLVLALLTLCAFLESTYLSLAMPPIIRIASHVLMASSLKLLLGLRLSCRVVQLIGSAHRSNTLLLGVQVYQTQNVLHAILAGSKTRRTPRDAP